MDFGLHKSLVPLLGHKKKCLQVLLYFIFFNALFSCVNRVLLVSVLHNRCAHLMVRSEFGSAGSRQNGGRKRRAETVSPRRRRSALHVGTAAAPEPEAQQRGRVAHSERRDRTGGAGAGGVRRTARAPSVRSAALRLPVEPIRGRVGRVEYRHLRLSAAMRTAHRIR